VVTSSPVLTVADTRFNKLTQLLGRFGLSLGLLNEGAAIKGSFWGEPEAGIVKRCVYVRLDTPIHSLLHESCHVICMDEKRREGLERDAGGDDIEEAAVCYLQVLLADLLPGVGRDRLMRDMDAWGYSFRLGSTRAWFESDAGDAAAWLLGHELITATGVPTFTLRK
jgi:hypothetical protein